MKYKTIKFKVSGDLATLTLDDGDKNLVTPLMIKEINKALDQVEEGQWTLLILGREGIFSAGFDLKVLKDGNLDTLKMLFGAFELITRLYGLSRPVVIGSTGHAIAMGAFILLCGDYRIGAEGKFKYLVNEVANSLNMPYTAIEICKERLHPTFWSRVLLLSETFNTKQALAAGFLDETAKDSDLESRAIEKAIELSKLPSQAFSESKRRKRLPAIRSLKKANALDKGSFISLGLRQAIGKVRRS